MKLDCGIHVVPGNGADPHCRKCARRQGSPAQPTARPPSKVHSTRNCIGCESPAPLDSTVWGLRVCRRCGEWINDVAPIGPVTGFGYLIAVCAMVQYIRERFAAEKSARRAPPPHRSAA